ncbi:MAG TPA: phage baseplate assembly protein V [Solirubrobacteraceae bacterium]|nr:phage baseplate assembly protein V [Solirubrobacteraceae bacterium]
MDKRLTRLLERIENRYFGKYRGTVVDRADPQQLGRLKLKVPSVLADAVTGWAWPAASYAGKGIGLFAIPQVGDVVWVEFAEGELDQPLWTGCAWAAPGGSAEIPEEAKQAYPDRVVLRTPSGNVVILGDDAGKETIVVRTKTGCEIVLDPNADRITVQAGEVVVRGAAGQTEELATKTFVTKVFDTHTHATGVGPTGPPALPSTSNPRSLTKVLKAE